MQPAVDIASAYSRCELCPRRCGANRIKGETGWCRASARVRLHSFQPHHGEEPPISGTGGSGAMFFSRCTMGCIYCQNYPWSRLGQGEEYDAKELAGVFRHLRDKGCHNWNWVTPTPWLPSLLEALDGIAEAGERLLPVVYNTSGYERVETIKALDGRVAVYLADLRYADNAVAKEASGVSNYVETARAALEEMHRQRGPLREQNGTAVSGLIVRILVLPGRQAEACANLRWIAERLGTDTAVSVMAQYVPAFRARESPQWNRTITSIEYEQVCATVRECGFYAGWIQEPDMPAPNGLIGFEMAARNKAGIAEHNGGKDERS